MVVNSLEFLAFFAVVFFVYYFPLWERTTAQNWLLLAASYFFYGYADLKMLPLLVGATLVFYVLGIAIGKNESRERLMGWLMVLGVVLGVGLLAYFKYLNFFIEQFSALFNVLGLQTNWHTFSILLPIGISFFTFRLISYVLEIYFGRIEPCRDFVAFATYVSFFPCILAGPIDRPQTFIPQLRSRRVFDYSLATDGLRQILWGMFKKMVIADNCAKVVDTVWADYGNYNGSSLVLVAVLYAFQIYADFSGYSDMAIGVGKLLGFRITKNFNYPYFAQNIADFWRRWHISLTTWVTDYVFTPLTMKFGAWGKFGLILAITANFFILGLWHGANWTFILFGIWHTLLFIPLIFSGKLSKLPKIESCAKGLLPTPKTFFRATFTFILLMPGLLLFRAPSVSDFFAYCQHMLFSGTLLCSPKGIGIGYTTPIFLLFLILLEWIFHRMEFPISALPLRSRVIRWAFYFILLCVILQFDGGTTTFIYLQF